MKAKQRRRGEGGNRGGLAYGGLAQRTSGAVKTGENRTVRRRELGTKKASYAPAKIGAHGTLSLLSEVAHQPGLTPRRLSTEAIPLVKLRDSGDWNIVPLAVPNLTTTFKRSEGSTW